MFQSGFSRWQKITLSGQIGMILEELMFSKRDIELAKIAGYMHDIGNVINRQIMHNRELIEHRLLL